MHRSLPFSWMSFRLQTIDSLKEKANKSSREDVNCLFNISSIRDVSVGENTKQVAVQLESESYELRKLTPILQIT